MNTKPTHRPSENVSPGTGSAHAAPSQSAPAVRRIASDQMFGSSQEIEIEHNGALYRLRKTSLGKLILTK